MTPHRPPKAAPALVRLTVPGRQIWTVRIAGRDAGLIERCAADAGRGRRQSWLATTAGLPPRLFATQAAAIDSVAEAQRQADLARLAACAFPTPVRPAETAR